MSRSLWWSPDRAEAEAKRDFFQQQLCEGAGRESFFHDKEYVIEERKTRKGNIAFVIGLATRGGKPFTYYRGPLQKGIPA